MNCEVMSRAALGSVASLGELYDARTDHFLKMSIFNRTIPPEKLNVKNNLVSDIQIIHSDSYSEKFSKLNINDELQVSVLAGLLTLQGSSLFLNDKKTSARTVKGSLLYNIKTLEESFNIYDEALNDAFDVSSIVSGSATHVVVGITWGANCILSCEYQNAEIQDLKSIERNLFAQLENIRSAIAGESPFQCEYNKGRNCELHWYGDLLPNKEDLPTILEEAVNLLKQMSNLVEKSHQSSGKPLTYTMIPLSTLMDHLKLSVKFENIIRFIEKDNLLHIVQLFENFSSDMEIINDYYQHVITYWFCVAQKDVLKISQLIEELKTKKSQFCLDLASTLTVVRSGNENVSILIDLIEKFPIVNVSVHFNSWKHIDEKISFYKLLNSYGCKYIGLETSPSKEIMKYYKTKVFVLYFKLEAKSSNTEKWEKNVHIFVQEMDKNVDDNTFIAVDCDIHPDMWPKNETSIQVLHNGQVISEDYIKDVKAIANIPVARCFISMTQITTKPKKRINLVIPCTGRNCKPNVNYEWICHKCREKIEFGFDDKFYCSCGCGPSDSYEFKCSDAQHGLRYDSHNDNGIVKFYLSRLTTQKEVNILILGETGVGKSTFINLFYNLLTFKTLQEAEENELCSLIPSAFTVSNDDFKVIKICTGEDDNEIQICGQSATQSPKVYSFIIDDTRIRLIDTPGIGDTRGIDQDNINFEKILTYLSYFDELHGICILLKPNNARLNVMFRFCIKELLTYLHNDASKNILFCFTNTRGTSYRPGETLPVLQALLNKNQQVEIPLSKQTIYCFDSEAVRFLAAVKNKDEAINFSQKERINFEESWDVSMCEMKRMLKHISELTPHTVNSTLSLNTVREVVRKLTQPLAEIAKNIQKNIELNDDRSVELKKTNEDIENLKQKVYYEKIELEVIPLRYPKVVCTNVNCTKVFEQENSNEYNCFRPCQDECTRKLVRDDSVGCKKLLFRSCIKLIGNCKLKDCGHSYKEHRHVYYESIKVKKRIEDESIKKLLHSNLSAANIKQYITEEMTKEIEELKQELEEVKKSSVIFAHFLKKYAITPYNDEMEAYMELLIQDENKKMSAGAIDTTLQSFEKRLRSYKIEVENLEQEMLKGDLNTTGIMISDVNNLIDELFKLKHSGKFLQDSLVAVKTAYKNAADYQEAVILREENQTKILT